MIPGFVSPMFFAGFEPPKELVLIDRTTGTNIGDMTGFAGLAAAFDGVTNQTAGLCAGKTSSSSSGWIGKTLAGPRTIGRVVVFGANNGGYVGVNGNNVTLRLYGKQGTAPTGATNGTIISTQTFSNSFTTNSRVLESTDLSTPWDHVWVTTLPTGSVSAMYMAEVQMYAWE